MGGRAPAACRQHLGVLTEIMDKAGLALILQAVHWGGGGQIYVCTAASDTGAVIFKGDGETFDWEIRNMSDCHC